MILCLIFGVTFALVHHFFANYLSHNPSGIGTISPDGYKNVNQELVSAISNVLSLLVGGLFTAAIDIGLAQWFWYLLRKREFKIKQINSVFAASRANPFLPSSIRSWLPSSIVRLMRSTS